MGTSHYRGRADQVALLGHLAYVVPELVPILDEHLDDNESEMLPHLLIADYERWAEDAIENGIDVSRLLEELELAFAADRHKIRELIAVSFLEHLPESGERGGAIRSMLGPQLREELSRLG